MQKIYPDNLDNWLKAGFEKFSPRSRAIVSRNEKIKIKKLYFSEGACSFYSADIGIGQMHVQMIPTLSLPDYLQELHESGNGEGWFDLIVLREGDRDYYGLSNSLVKKFSNAGAFLKYLNTYMRLPDKKSGVPETFQYIQIGFIQFY